MPESKPYVPSDSTEREFTIKAVIAGILMAALFGASNAYLGMKAGQTVAATIPAAVIAILTDAQAFGLAKELADR